MNVVITNAYTWYNKGDAGILLGTVRLLEKLYKENLSIDILSFTPKEDQEHYLLDKNIHKIYSNILNPRPYRNTKIGKIIAILKLIIKLIHIEFLLIFNKNKLLKKYPAIKSIKDSDFVIVCGGGFLGGKKIDSFMHLYQIYINTIFSKKVYILGTSIEPMNNFLVKIITDYVLKKVNYIFAREKYTYDYLNKILSHNKFDLIPDLAFMLDNISKDNNEIKKLKKNWTVCGITVRNWKFPNSKKPKIKMEKYINSISKIIDYFYETQNLLFIFVPQVIVNNGNDIDIAKKIKEKLVNEEALMIIEEDLSPIELKSLIGNFDIFLGTRMHSNIFAVSMTIPTLAIAYEKKTNGIMHMLNLDDYIIDIENINFNELKNKLFDLMKKREILSNNLKIQIPKIRMEIIEKFKKVMVNYK